MQVEKKRRKKDNTICNQTVRSMLKASFKMDATYRSKTEIEEFVTQMNQIAKQDPVEGISNESYKIRYIKND